MMSRCSKPVTASVASQLIARLVPGKGEFDETLRYFGVRLDETGVDIRLDTAATPEVLADFDAVVLATGVTPRVPDIPGVDHPCVATYLQVLRGEVEVGRRVAILGASGIGFDVAEYLTDAGQHTSSNACHVPAFFESWGSTPPTGKRVA